MSLLDFAMEHPLIALAAWFLLAGWILDFRSNECGHYRSDV